MRTTATDLFDIDLPIFAFSHCRDVVAAVSKAGGMGVLGAVSHSPSSSGSISTGSKSRSGTARTGSI